MPVNLQGTNGPDKVVVGPGENFNALGGDDDISLAGGGSSASPGPGNDTIRVLGNQGRFDHAVYYWDSPAAILVDLKNGYANDGYGTRDTLIGVRSVHGFCRDGDRGIGSGADEQFFLRLDGMLPRGRIVIDAGAGNDVASFYIPRNAKSQTLSYSVSADARKVLVWNPLAPDFVAELIGFEELSFYQEATNSGWTVKATEAASLAQAGPDILLRGARGWQPAAGAGQPLTLSFSFLDARPAEGGEGGVGFNAFDTAQRAVVRDLLQRLSAQTLITFQEVPGDQGQIRLGINQQANTRGYSFVPGLSPSAAVDGDVWLDVETAAVMQPGQEGFYVLLHELGHALGLQHPLPASDTSGATVLLPSLATTQNTVMIDDGATSAMRVWPTWFGMMDLQALRSLYGSRGLSIGDDVYDLARLTALMGGLLVDDGGVDTVDFANSTTGVQVDLRPGKTWSFGGDAQGQFRANLTLAWGSVIEHVRGSPGDDDLIGNDLDNTFASMGGNDLIDGGAGFDTVLFSQTASSYRLGWAGGAVMVSARSGSEGVVQLQSVEMLGFADRRVSLPTKAHASYSDLPDSLYQFFIVAFGAAPGVVYMDQIAQAYRAGATVRQIVDAFISKPQFTDTYPLSLSNRALADKLVAKVVGNSASATARAEAVSAIEQTLDNGAPRGQVIFTVFGNLANKPLEGDTWSGTAVQFQKQVMAAKVYTDAMSMASEDLAVLRSVLSQVTPDSETGTTDAVVQLIGLGLFGP
ncbi:MAG: Serralysin precursor [Pseudomonadota bacterium]